MVFTQHNANIERQLPGDILLTAGYAGSTREHLTASSVMLSPSTASACGTVSGYTIGCLPYGAAYSYPYLPNFNSILLYGDPARRITTYS